jgi:tetratricopeptide (TPR) repeat protein
MRGLLAALPTDRPALRDLGAAAFALGRYADARAAYERAALLLSRDVPLQLALGRACLRQGDLAAAAAAYERAETLDPTNTDARIGRGWTSLLAGRPAEAAALWRPVVAYARDFDTLRRMVELYQSLGDRAAADDARAALARLGGGR